MVLHRLCKVGTQLDVLKSAFFAGATNLGTWKQNVPAGFGIYKVMNADPYRGPWGGKNCRDSISQVRVV